MFPLFRLLAFLFCYAPLFADTVIQLTGTQASESNGNGHAFNIPNFDGIDVNPDGSINYNPLTYPPLPFDPIDPESQITPGTSFNFGTITYDETTLNESEEEFIPVTNDMFAFDFSNYSLALGMELDVRPADAGGTTITLMDITGPGLKFVGGEPVSLNFTARVEWRPKLNGFNQTFLPYTGTLEVVNGTFTFAMSDGPQNWTIGALNVDFEFDLIATVDSLAHFPGPVALPSLVLQPNNDNLILTIVFNDPPNRTYQLESSLTLAPDSWIVVGKPFSQGLIPGPQHFVIGSETTRFFRVRVFQPIEQLIDHKIQ